jgi:hypothetical protein
LSTFINEKNAKNSKNAKIFSKKVFGFLKMDKKNVQNRKPKILFGKN